MLTPGKPTVFPFLPPRGTSLFPAPYRSSTPFGYFLQTENISKGLAKSSRDFSPSQFESKLGAKLLRYFAGLAGLGKFSVKNREDFLMIFNLKL
jgi:hypothetical protein